MKNNLEPQPLLAISELPATGMKDVPTLFEAGTGEAHANDEAGKIVFDLSFKYGKHKFRGGDSEQVSVTLEKPEGQYVFHRVKKDTDSEKKFASTLIKLWLPLGGNFRAAVGKAHAFSWINENRVNLLNFGFEVSHPHNPDKKYFVGKAIIDRRCAAVRPGNPWPAQGAAGLFACCAAAAHSDAARQPQPQSGQRGGGGGVRGLAPVRLRRRGV